GTLPVPRLDVQNRQPAQQRANRTRECRVAQQLRQHRGRQRELSVIERRLDELHIIAGLALEKGDHRARISRNHAPSSRSRTASSENLTVPRSFATSRNSSAAATRRSPWRTV